MNFPTPIKILDQSHVSPPPLSAGEARPSLPLTFFDILWLNFGPVERLYFYHFPYSTSHFFDIHFPILKSALSTFYPLAATIRRRSDCRFEIATAESDSVSLTFAEYAQPLFAVQLTLFPNNGLCLAYAVHHSTCDGFSLTQFFKLWSDTSAASFEPDRLIPRSAAPVMDRTVIPDPRNLYKQMEEAVAKEKMVTSGTDDGVFAATFTLSAAEIGRLKKQVEKKAAEQGMPSFHCSTFVVSCAYSWICLLRTRCITDGDGRAHLVFPVDRRRRIRPAIPANYFGNCLSGCFVKWDAKELLSRDGVLVACAAIGKGIEELGDDVNESMDGLLDRIGEEAPWRPLVLAGSHKFGVYERDFGWGKPRKVEVISTREKGAMAMAESRDGEGGVEVGLILPEEELKAFANYFAAGLDWTADLRSVC